MNPSPIETETASFFARSLIGAPFNLSQSAYPLYGNPIARYGRSY